MRATVFLVVLVSLRGAEAAPQKPAKLSDAEAKRVAALIGQLDNKKFAEREKAMKALAKFGERALPLLEKAERRPVSLETRRRLNVVIWKLRAPAREEVAKRVTALIPQMSDPSFSVRETAMKELQAVGRVALEHLYGATLRPDPETVRRAEVVIARILKKMK